MRVLLSLVALGLSACTSLSDRASEMLAEGPEGTRWGLVVMTMDGRELVSIRPDERFTPASNTKLFTAAAAFHRLGDMTVPDPSMGTSVRLKPNADGPPDIILVGGGDAMLIDAPDCERDCLSSLADAVVSNGVTEIGGVIADDTLYPFERWGPGWSHEDLLTRSGAPVSALTVNSNELSLVITPGATPGDKAIVAWRENPPLAQITGVVTSVAEQTSAEGVIIERGWGAVRVEGRVTAGGPTIVRPIAVEDPAQAAADRFVALLREREIEAGATAIYHRQTALTDFDPDATGFAPLKWEGVEIGRLLPPPLIEDVTFLMKQSQNQHSEMLLRRLGLIEGSGSRVHGLAVIEDMLSEAGASRNSWDFADGSGMSVYNRVTPRMVANFLRWTTAQPWGEAFRATLPIGGVDGTLRRRFGGTLLEGKVFAKTGTLRGVNALSGFMTTKSGKTLIFSAYANDRPSEAGSAIAAMDAALVTIAEMN